MHKGTFGTLGIIGGASGMVGAALLAGRAAQRCGAGKVRVGFIAADRPGVDTTLPELMLGDASQVLDAGADVWLVGCGLGVDDAARNALDRVIAADAPLVLDADALNLIAADPKLRRSVRSRDAATIATPHPAEAARLLGTSVAAIQHDRIEAAHSIARELRAHVVLKGAGSVLAHPDRPLGHQRQRQSGACVRRLRRRAGRHARGMPRAASRRRWLRRESPSACTVPPPTALVARGIGPIGLSGAELVDAARDLLESRDRARVRRLFASAC